MRISQLLHTRSPRISVTCSVQQALERMDDEGSGVLVVCDDLGRMVGTVARGQLLAAAMPDLVELAACGGSMEDARASFERCAARMAGRSVGRYAETPTVVLDPEDDAFTAATALVQGGLDGAPVLAQGQLVGWVSQSALCAALMSGMGRVREAA